MTRSPDSLIPVDAQQPAPEKRDDKAFDRRQEGEANLRAATQVKAVSALSTPPAITPIQSADVVDRSIVGGLQSMSPALFWRKSNSTFS
jgi:hypothetical protein